MRRREAIDLDYKVLELLDKKSKPSHGITCRFITKVLKEENKRVRSSLFYLQRKGYIRIESKSGRGGAAKWSLTERGKEYLDEEKR